MFLRHPPPFPEFGISDTAFEDLSRAHIFDFEFFPNFNDSNSVCNAKIKY